MTEQHPAALPPRKAWAQIGSLYAALRRTAPTMTATPMPGEIPAHGPDPFMWVTYQFLGPYKVQCREDGYQFTSGQFAGEKLGADPEVAARRLAEMMRAPILAP